MDSIGDFLYLLLMIGAIIFSVVRKSREKKMPPPPMPNKPATDIGDFFPELKNWLEDEDTDTYKQPEVVEQPKVSASVLGAPVFTYDSPDQAQPVRSVSKATAKPAKNIEEVNEVGFFDDEPFDLRKAVVYSEILKRPNWY